MSAKMAANGIRFKPLDHSAIAELSCWFKNVS